MNAPTVLNGKLVVLITYFALYMCLFIHWPFPFKCCLRVKPDLNRKKEDRHLSNYAIEQDIWTTLFNEYLCTQNGYATKEFDRSIHRESGSLQT
jgi:hypothetical protein